MMEPQIVSLHIRYRLRAVNNICTLKLSHIWQPWYMLKLIYQENISASSIISLVQQAQRCWEMDSRVRMLHCKMYLKSRSMTANIQRNYHLMFPHVNKLSVKFSPFKTFLNLVFKSRFPQRNLKWGLYCRHK
jgi:hypothetical protein